MFRIRVLHSTTLPGQRERVAQVQKILRENFPENADYADRIPDMLDRPFSYGYRSALLTAESSLGRVSGFVLMLSFPAIKFSFIDYIAVSSRNYGSGIGSALYEAAREYCSEIGSRGLFFEVDPDDEPPPGKPGAMAGIRKRMRFYELLGIRPIVNTLYDEPVGEPPTRAYLMFDGLDRTEQLARDEVQRAVRLIMTDRYRISDPGYINRVVESFTDDPVRFRPYRYVKQGDLYPAVKPGRLERKFILVSGDGHAIHHVRSRGYMERPARIEALKEAMVKTGLFTIAPVRHFGEEVVTAVHDRHFVKFLKTVCMKLGGDRPVYPDTFPIRRPDRRPKELPEQAGYYCIDTSTPLDKNAYLAARGAVDVAMTAATELLAGARIAFALTRPPGHHAERRTYGGFCYFNNAAIAAHHLSMSGRVAVLDIDFHHGNGTQDIFYQRSDVLTVSIHGHPDQTYPYFSGFMDETGEGEGAGYNRNIPLPPGTGGDAYFEAFEKAFHGVERFKPAYLVVSLGFDILRGDPTGTFQVRTDLFERMGRRLAGAGIPLLVVQEGGYNLRNLRRGAAAFFYGLSAGMQGV